MYDVLIHGRGKIGTHGARRSILGIGSAHQLAVPDNGILALQYLHHHGSGTHEIHERPEKWPLAMDRIEGLSLVSGQTQHTGGHNPEVRLLEARVNFTDEVLCDAIGLDDRQGTFDRHSTTPGAARRTGAVLPPHARACNGPRITVCRSIDPAKCTGRGRVQAMDHAGRVH